MGKPTDKPLSLRAQKFVAELLANPKLNQTEAAIAAGFSARSAHVTSTQLLHDPRVQALLTEKQRETVARLELKAEDVLRDIFHVVEADANELTEYRVGCCRYCHGDGFQYQRTPQEYRDALASYRMTPDGKLDPLALKFDHRGGVGYDMRKDPRQDCPECFGEGVGRTIVKDTRKLSLAARTLYAGVKETRHGIEVMTRSKDKAIDLAARHTGVVKSSVEVVGKGGGPVQHAGAVVSLTTTDPIEASREYQKLMGG